MPDLPALNARQVVQILSKLGFVKARQKGSHLVMVNAQTGARTVVPIHSGRTIKKGLLRGIIADTGMTIEKFLSSR